MTNEPAGGRYRGVGQLIDALPTAERRAVALVTLAIRMHGGFDGDGLFTGPDRYRVLAARMVLAAERSRDVRGFFDLLARLMRWPLGPTKWHDDALRLISPQENDAETLRALAERSQSLVMIARALDRRTKAVERGEPLPNLSPPDDPLSVFDEDPGAELDGNSPAGGDDDLARDTTET